MKPKKLLALVLAFLLAVQLIPGDLRFTADAAEAPQAAVRLGIDNIDDYLDIFADKKVGLITNASGINSSMESSIDVLFEKVELTALFAPEHGIRGTAQDGGSVGNEIDEKTGLPVYSLYGSTKKPTPEMLENVDVLVYDMQDVGARFYTYISTMLYAMEAAQENGKTFVVLDRPNPVSGKVEGNLLREGYESFVGTLKIPHRYGMTAGELAQYINEEEGIGCDLKVVKMTGWTRDMYYDETGLNTWVMPSPNMPTLDTAIVYPGNCMFEGTTLSEGRGTTRPFELIGAPYIKSTELADALNALNLPGVKFRAASFTPTFNKHANVLCGGVQTYVTDRNTYNSVKTGYAMLYTIKELYPDDFQFRTDNYIDNLSGFDAIRKGTYTLEELFELVDQEAADFQAATEKYYLYHETNENDHGGPAKVTLGVDNIDDYMDLFAGKRVGLITGPSGMDQNFNSTIDVLFEKTDLTTLFAAEHGIRGNAQAGGSVGNEIDEKTGLPVISLYGSTKKPTPEMLENVDVLVYDIQDVGARFYTYINTLAYAMEAAQENGKTMVVLDRPNPISGTAFDGNYLKEENSSFVGLYPIIHRYGLTVGEYASYINERFDIGCDLKVVDMEGWTRDMYYDDTGLDTWVLPSPNMPTLDTAVVYPGTCLIEGTNVSEGRGTTRPFELIGAPWINAFELADALNALNLPGAYFRATAFTPQFSKFKGEVCQGVQVCAFDRDVYDAVKVGTALVYTIRDLYPDDFEYRSDNYMDLLAGIDDVRLGTYTLEELFDLYDRESAQFKSEVEKYFRYDNTATATRTMADLAGSYQVLGRSAADGTGITMDSTANGVRFTADCIGTVKATFTTWQTADNSKTFKDLYFTVYVDGVRSDARVKLPVRTEKQQTTVVLAEGLPAGEHTIELFRQTENEHNVATLESITLAGSFLEAAGQNNLSIEFVGDSLTAGYGNLGKAGDSNPGSPLLQDGTQAYAFMAARELGADLSVIAMSGHGLVGGWKVGWNVPKAYPYTNWYRDHEDSGKYDFARPSDVVVVNLGTNDWNTKDLSSVGNNITPESFKQGVIDLTNTIRANNPGAKIVWVYGMMIPETDGFNPQILEAVEELGGASNGLYAAHIPCGASGANGHPNVAEQKEAADALVSFLESNVLYSMADLKLQVKVSGRTYDKGQQTGEHVWYQQSSWDAFAAAYDAANAVLAKGEAATNKEIMDAVEQLKAAQAGLVRVDKTELASLIASADAKVADGTVDRLIASVKTQFLAALADAKAVYDNTDASVQDTVRGYNDLLDQMHNLDFVAGDKTELGALLRMMEGVDLNQYLSTGKDAYIEALAAAKDVYADGDALQADVDKAYEDLFDAFMNLVPKADKALLNALIEKAESLDLGQYVDAGKDAFETALRAAKTVSAYEEATQAQVSEAAKALSDAMKALRKVASKENLAKLLAQANAVDATRFTAASVRTLRAAAAEGQKVYDDKTLDESQQSVVDLAAAKLDTAIKGLKPVGANTGGQNSKPNTGSTNTGTPNTGTQESAAAVGMLAVTALGVLAALGRKRRNVR